MIFYHGTETDTWCKIKKSVLWGIPADIPGVPPCGYRYTYLTPNIIMAAQYGAVTLEIEYEPSGLPRDNYGFDPPQGQYCWQFSVFVPIKLHHNVRRLHQDEIDALVAVCPYE